MAHAKAIVYFVDCLEKILRTGVEISFLTVYSCHVMFMLKLIHIPTHIDDIPLLLFSMPRSFLQRSIKAVMLTLNLHFESIQLSSY